MGGARWEKQRGGFRACNYVDTNDLRLAAEQGEEPPAVLTGCYVRWWSCSSFQICAATLASRRLQSTWLGSNPRFHFSRLGCTLGPWRNQFKWLSVDVIDFHFTRLSRKMHYHPAPVYTFRFHTIPSPVTHLALIRIMYLQSQFSFLLELEVSVLGNIEIKVDEIGSYLSCLLLLRSKSDPICRVAR